MTPDEELRPDRREDVPFQERTALIDGARIYVRDYPGEGNPIPLIHGPLDNLHLHDGVVPHLISTRRVVNLRLPRWGASDKPASYHPTARKQPRHPEARTPAARP